MKAKLISLLLALAMIFSLVACGTNDTVEETPNDPVVEQPSVPVEDAPSEPVEEGYQPYTFVDDLGHEIEITEEITAIVPSGQLAQVIMLGVAPDLMVGLGGKLYKDMAEFIPDYDRLSQLTYFGTVLGAADLDVEALASTNAQLVIDMGYTKTGYEEELANTEKLTGITCVFIEAAAVGPRGKMRRDGQLVRRGL
jgi:ABC-type Fe3+-hydroxamate transport system substrate-binding protein